MTLYFGIPFDYPYQWHLGRHETSIIDVAATAINEEFLIKSRLIRRRDLKEPFCDQKYDFYEFCGNDDEFLIFIIKSGFYVVEGVI